MDNHGNANPDIEVVKADTPQSNTQPTQPQSTFQAYHRAQTVLIEDMNSSDYDSILNKTGGKAPSYVSGIANKI